MTDGIATGFQGIGQQGNQGGDTRAFETAAKKAGEKQPPVFERFPDKGIVKVHEGEKFVYDFKAKDPDGGEQTYELTHKADSEKFTIDRHTGVLTFKDAPDFEHPTDGNKDNVYDVEIKLVDDEGQTTKKTIWVKIQDKDDGKDDGGKGDDKGDDNHAPHFTRFPDNGIINVHEGVTGEIFNFASSDKDGDDVAYSLGGVDGDKFRITEENGRLSFKTAPDFEAPADRNGDNTYDVDIILTDEHGATTKKTVWVKVGDKDETPAGPEITNKAKDGIYHIDENTTFVTDFEATGEDVRFSLNPTKADGEFFTIDEHTGELSFKEAPDFENPLDGTRTPPDNIYDVEIIVTDKHGQTDKCDIWVKVKDVDEKVDEKPVFDDLPEDGQLSITENETFVIDIDSTDPDGGDTTYSIVGGADGDKFTIDENTGELSFKDAPDFENPADRNADNKYDVKVRITDDEHQTCDKLLWVMVNDAEETPPNEKPVFTNLPEDGKIHLDENNKHVIDIESRDPNGDDVTYSITGGRDADFFEIDAHTGKLSFKEAPDFENPQSGGNNNTYDVKVTVSDGHESCDKMLWVKIKDVDETPPNSVDAVDDSASTDEGTVVTIDVRGNDTDPENDLFEVTQIAGQDATVGTPVPVENGTATLRADGKVDFLPADGFSGDTSFEYTITDANNATDTATVNVHVRDAGPVDPDKVLVDFNEFAAGDMPTDFDGLFIQGFKPGSDVSAGMVFDTANPTGGDGDLGVEGQGKVFIVSEDGDATDPDDNAGGAEFVLAFDNPSTFESVTVIDIEEKGGTIELFGADGFIRAIDVPAGGDGSVKTIEIDAEGVTGASIKLVGSGAIDDICFVKGKEPVDEKPVFTNLPEDGKIHLNEGEVKVVDIEGNDPDGGDVTYSITGGRDAEFFTIDADTGELSFKEARDFENPQSGGNNNTYDVKVTITDDEHTTCEKALWVKIKDVDENTAPDAVDDGATTDFDTPISIPVLTNDTDLENDTLSIVGTTDPANGSIEVVDGQIVYTPDDGFSGDDEFTYTISDGNGGEDTATVRVHVGEQPNRKPTFDNLPQDGKIHLVEGVVEVVDIDGTDLDGDDLTYSIVGGRDADFFTIDPQTGQLSFKEARDFENPQSGGGNNTYDVKVRVSDGELSCDKALWVKIKDVDETPPNSVDAVDDTGFTTEQGEAVSIPALVNDTDPEGDFFEITQVNGQDITPTTFGGAGNEVRVENGTVGLSISDALDPNDPPNANVTFQFTPDADFVGETSFEYTIRDANGATDTATVTVGVEAKQNEKPTFDNGIGPDAPKNDRKIHVDENTIEVIDVDATDPDGDPVSFELVASKADTDLFTIDEHTGLLTFKEAPDFENPADGNKNNVYDVHIRVKDDQGNFCDTVLWVKVKDVDETPDPIAPVATDDTETTQPGQSVIVDATDNDTDPDGNDEALFVSTVNGLPIAPLPDPVPPVLVTPDTAQVTNGTVKLLPDGTFEVTPNEGFVGGDITFEYTARDEQGLESAPATVTVKVDAAPPANNVPVAGDDVFHTDENQTFHGDVTKNDTVLDGPATFEATSDPANGTLTFRHDGTFDYVPTDGFDGVDSFTYEVRDADGETATATVVIIVKDTIAENRAPDADNDFEETDENVAATIDVLGNDSDPENDDLTITDTTAPANGTIEVVDGKIVYTPNDGFSGTDEFTYTISDGELTDTATVNVCVKDTIADNLAPVARDDSASTAFDTPVTIDAYADDFDPDGPDNAVFPGTLNQPANGTVELVGGQFVYTPNAGFSGTDSFTYTVVDNEGLESNEATVTVTVAKEDLEPKAKDDKEEVEGGKTLHESVAGNDDLGDPDNTFSVVSDALNGTLTFREDGSYDYKPNDGFVGTDTFRYRITDGDGDKSTATVRIHVTAPNKVPNAVDDAVTVEAGTVATGDVLKNDDPGDGLASIALEDAPVNGSVTLNDDGSFSYEAVDGFVGNDSFTYTITDTDGETSTATVTVTVTEEDIHPAAVDDLDEMTHQDRPLHGDVSGNDIPGNDPLDNVWELVHGPVNGTIVFNADGTYDYTPNAGFVGKDQFSYKLTDGDGDMDRAKVIIEVKGKADDGVTAVDDTNETDENTPVSGNVLENDEDGDDTRDLMAFLTSQPGNGTVTLARDGGYTYTPDDGFSGTDSFTYIAIDGDGDRDEATVTITVKEEQKVDEKPVFTNLPADGKIHIDEGEVQVIDIDGNDPDGGDVTYSIVGGRDADFFEIDPATGELTFKEARDFEHPASGGGNNTYDVTVRITDDEHQTCDKALWVKIKDVDETPANTPPKAVDDGASTDEGETVNIKVIDNDTDPDGDDVEVTRIVTQPANGSATLLTDGTVDYTPDADFVGTDTFTYEITDGNGGTDIATVTVTVDEDGDPVDPVDKKPDADNDEFTGQGGTPITGDVADNDDLGDTPSTFAALTQPANGTLVLNDDGTFTYTPKFGFTGTDSFVYTVTDEDGDMDAAVVKLTVEKDTADIEPVARNDEFDVTSGATLTETVAENDDLGNTPSVFSQLSDPSNGTVAFNDDGKFTYTANDGFVGTDAFAYQITDADGDVSTAIVCLKVEKGDTPPTDEKPDAVRDRETTPFETPLTASVAENDRDGDGTSTFSVIRQPENGTLEFNADGSYTYTPDAGFSGVDRFRYEIADEDGDTDRANVRITVGDDPNPPVDKKPDADEDSFNGDFGQTVTGDVSLNDDPGDAPATFELVTGSPDGTVTVNADGTFSFVPNAGFSGDTQFTYRITDADDDSDTATVSIHIREDDTPVDEKPVFTNLPGNGKIHIQEGEVDVIDIDGNDPDGGDVTFSIVGGADADSFDIDPNTGELTFRTAPDFEEPTDKNGNNVYDVTVRITDDEHTTCDKTLWVKVKDVDETPPNTPPVAKDDKETTAFETPVTITASVNDSDVDGDLLQVATIDGQPVAPNDVVQVDDGTVEYRLALPGGGGASLYQFTFTPDAGFSGDTSFDYTISDGKGGTDTAHVSIHVEKPVVPEKPPVADDDKAETEQGDAVIIDVLDGDVDPDGDDDKLQVHEITRQPDNGSAVVNVNGTITYTPDPDFFGTDTFEYEVVDEQGLKDTATVTVHVEKDEPEKLPPVAVNDGAKGPAGTPLMIDLRANDSDPDGTREELTVTSIAGQPVTAGSQVDVGNAIVTVNDAGKVTVTPKDPHFVGTVGFDYHITDAHELTATAHVIAEFEPKPNTDPHPVKDGYYLRPGLHYMLPVLHNDKDADGDRLHITEINGHKIAPCQSVRVDGGIVTLRKDGQLVFKGNRGTYGDFDFTYTVSDGKGGKGTAEVCICLTAGGTRH